MEGAPAIEQRFLLSPRSVSPAYHGQEAPHSKRKPTAYARRPTGDVGRQWRTTSRQCRDRSDNRRTSAASEPVSSYPPSLPLRNRNGVSDSSSAADRTMVRCLPPSAEAMRLSQPSAVARPVRGSSRTCQRGHQAISTGTWWQVRSQDSQICSMPTGHGVADLGSGARPSPAVRYRVFACALAISITSAEPSNGS